MSIKPGNAHDKGKDDVKSCSLLVPPVKEKWEYQVYPNNSEVQEVLEEYEDVDDSQYLVRFSNGSQTEVSYAQLLNFANGFRALHLFNSRNSDDQGESASASSSSSAMVGTRSTRTTRLKAPGFTDFSHVALSSDDELTKYETTKPRNSRRLQQRKSMTQASTRASDQSNLDERPRRQQAFRNANRQVNYNDAIGLDDSQDESSDGATVLGKRKRRPTTALPTGSGLRKPSGARRSDRSGRELRSMHEIGEDDIPEMADLQIISKVVRAKESFQPIPPDNDFRVRHQDRCDTCDHPDDDEQKGILVYCQGCTMSYHQRCLGPRNSREHLVTKVGDRNFILQCRRCIGVARQKDPFAPDQAKCSVCYCTTIASGPFRERKTTRQEQKEREENGGEDPITAVAESAINSVDNVLFRCTGCFRGFHFHHLPSKEPDIIDADMSEQNLAEKRFEDYCKFGTWTCKACTTAPAKVDSLIAWRPSNHDNYIPGTATDSVHEDDKEYLVRWEKRSYFKSLWMPGPWVWGITSQRMRQAFANRNNGKNLPKMRFEDAVPEDWLRIDTVLDIRYTSVVKVQVEEVDLKRVKEVKQAYVKFKGLGYEDAVWDEPPDPQDTERWADFQAAYANWVRGRYIHLPTISALNNRLVKQRSRDFEGEMIVKQQPAALMGGELMSYQLEGLNWLYYQWHRQQSAILADEMGLGKTVQVIAFLLTLMQTHGCWPFLVVVPNSTCANWRREIKQWAPSLRVVTYFGSSDARRLSKRYELFPGQDQDLRCHVVVTSYDAAQDDEFRKVFRKINWQALIVDEGQRLKNDKNILYGSLSALKVPFKVLLTGTPLQNNPRELFNLLQFLDNTVDAAELEQEYTELTKDNIRRLHEMLRPFFLRRTKAQVLSFLPAMAQLIVPVTLTILQKKLYKSILARNPELLKAIFGGSTRVLAKTERTNLNNILMQLRKCLCHPFVYNRDIEERTSNAVISHRNLVEASSKLQLLEIMLPKLQERGHRVLIFSQFLNMLDMIEDFMDGLGLFYQRLDGSMGPLEKQKRIDEFNAPDSRLFAFLLSTRAGGVGINLATADTVIILDPDFNPHQDIQALSRAHRIGQKRKVLIFQLTTRSTAEEKIMQIGKKKMALDHALIEQMDANEEGSLDLESILRHGTEALFQDDDANDIRYDSASVDKLLDRSQMEKTDIAKDQSAESQFSFARVWANDKGVLEDGLDADAESDFCAPDTSLWEKILQEREAEVAREAAEKAQALGRGKRQRMAVDYANGGIAEVHENPEKAKDVPGESSDTDFEAHNVESEEEEEEMSGEEDQDLTQELAAEGRSGLGSVDTERTFKRVDMAAVQARQYAGMHQPISAAGEAVYAGSPSFSQASKGAPSAPPRCLACGGTHVKGSCPLKMAGVEYCGLCGQAHYGSGPQKACSHLHVLEEVRKMLDAVKASPKETEGRELARKYLVGIIGHLRQVKRMEEKRREEQQVQQALSLHGQHSAPPSDSTGPPLNSTPPTSVPASKDKGRRQTDLRRKEEVKQAQDE
ncbi:MAG: hypothetical protein L6R37_004202 [Teloschistes peruensis]|nr:MAG: hypothetical protein L6R37_004202 [Teloschistes peruensis]